jgi:hypothetical protein
MDNYDEQIKPFLLRLKFIIKFKEFVLFLLRNNYGVINAKDKDILIKWTDLLYNEKNNRDTTDFINYVKHIISIKLTTVDTFISNVNFNLNNNNVSDEMLIKILKFIDLKNYE